MMQLIGDKIRTLRRKRGWSQEQLGAMVGFSQSKISKIEIGDWDSLSDLRLIARALGVPIEELVKEDEPDRKMSRKSSVGNVGTKWDTKLSGSEGKKDGVEAYIFKATNSDCNGYVQSRIDMAYPMLI